MCCKGCPVVLQQTGVLLRKNLTLGRRNWKSTAAQFIIPSIIVVLLYVIDIAVRGTAGENGRSTLTPAPESVPLTLPKCYVGAHLSKCYSLAYNRANLTVVQQIMALVMDDLDLGEEEVYALDGGPDDMNNFLFNNINTTQIALVFNFNTTDLPSGHGASLYTIQYNQTILGGCVSNEFWHCAQVARDLILPLQRSVNQALLNVLTNKVAKFTTDIGAFAHPVAQQVHIMSNAAPLFLLFALIFPLVLMLMQLVKEKESKLRFAMRTIGVRHAAVIFSWWIFYLTLALITVFLLIAVGQATGMDFFRANAFGTYFFLFVLFSVSMVATAFFFAAMFTSVKSARMASLAYLFIFGLFSGLGRFVYADSARESVSDGWRNFLALFPPIIFSKAVGDLASAAEVTRIDGTSGMTWDQRVNNTTLFPLSQCFQWLVLDIFIFSFLAWYLDNVLPDVMGGRRPLYFPFQASYWCRRRVQRVEQRPRELEQAPFGEDTDVTDERRRVFDEEDAEKVVRVKALRMLYKPMLAALGCGGKPFLAVEEASFGIQKDSLLCLLGPNGAGKTTTINILTGGLTATSGTATIHGFDIAADIDEIRKSLGVCPQFDVLWEELSGGENIRTFAALKGIRGDALEREVAARLAQVDLISAKDQPSGGYSGGMQRRLSVAMALTGDPKIVFLDEPTTGMDPVSRRKVWDIIEAAKKGRVVLLTTHSMEEADVLSDRIVIMTHGRPRCIGTSLHLKQKYGSGYRVTVIAHAAQLPAVRRDLLASFSGLDVMADTPVAFQVAVRPEMTPELPRVFEFLKGREGVKDFQIALTTLEDVFLRIAQEERLPDVLAEDALGKPATPASPTPSSPTTPGEGSRAARPPTPAASLIPDPPPAPRVRSQLAALIGKNWHLQKRKRLSNICQIAVPALIIVVMILLQVLVVKGSGDRITPEERNPQTYPIQLSGPSPGSNVPYTGANAALMMELLENIGMNLTTTPYSSFAEMQQHLFDIWFQGQSVNGAYAFDVVEPTTNTLTMMILYNRTFSLNYFSLLGYQAIAQQLFQTVTTGIPAMYMNQLALFPTPETVKKFDIVSLLATILFPLIFFFQFPVYVGNVMYDKERRLIEIMKQMGMKMYLYWLVSFVFDYLIYLLAVIVVVVLGNAFQFTIFSQNDFGVYFLLFLFWGWAMVSMSFFFTTLFAKERTATILSYLLVIASWIASGVVNQVLTAETNNNMAWFFYSCFPPFAFSRGFYQLGNIANTGTGGIKMKDLSRPDVIVGDMYAFLFVEGAILLLLNWYIGEVFPAGFGVRKSPVFCCMPSYWRTTCRRGAPSDEEAALLGRPINDFEPGGEEMEEEDEDVRAERLKVTSPQHYGEFAIRLTGLRKVYGKKVAVRGASFGVRKRECFGLLGHNGAGKTTIANMLSGLVEPTGGDAFVASMSIRREMDAIHAVLGVCPQHDLLWDAMTAREHLMFYGRLKRLAGAHLKSTVERTLMQLNLLPFADKLSREFSGGMKRRLSIGMAIIGRPRVVFLDEPTTGLDPGNRRDIWEVIAEACRGDTSVVLTTHSMEEAEALCDRIGIMANGSLRCVGPSSHLKQKFAAGYGVTITLHPDHATVRDQENAVRFVLEVLPTASHLPHSMGPTQHFHVPTEDVVLADLFRTMDARKAEYHVTDWVVSQTTLEDVFLRITADSEGEAT